MNMTIIWVNLLWRQFKCSDKHQATENGYKFRIISFIVTDFPSNFIVHVLYAGKTLIKNTFDNILRKGA